MPFTLHSVPFHSIPLAQLVEEEDEERAIYTPFRSIPFHSIPLAPLVEDEERALHYITLHYIALHCIVWHCIALHCLTLPCTALHDIVRQYVT